MFQPGQYWMENPVVGTAEAEKGTPYIYLEGEITYIRTGTADNGEPTYAGVATVERRTVFMYLSDKAFQYTVEKLESLNWNGDFRAPTIGEEHRGGIWVNCKHEMYNDKPRERWDLPGNGGIEHKSANPDALRKLAAMYKARKATSARPKPTSGPKPAPVGAAAEGPQDDPIPFDE